MTFLQIHNHEHEIILNTPNRNEILKEGPPQHSSSNILGRGAYGTVFKAVFNAKQVAVKIVKNLKDINLQSMRNESNILGWKHRNIIRILKVESTPNFGIVIMERFAGQCLQKILDSIELPLRHRVCITLDILSALIYCHRRNLLHLDVKPQNILVSFITEETHKAEQAQELRKRSPGYVCKLCDFGSSMKMDEQNKENLNRRATKGTVRYMSPEALRDEPLTPAADIYSLGITMWQLRQRKLPYHWIECNEIVAYQVVKNAIRPDSDAALLSAHHQHRTGERHRNCLCEHFSSEISQHSLDHIRNLLQNDETEVKSKQAIAAQYYEKCSPQPTSSQRTYFRELSPRLNTNSPRNSSPKLNPQLLAHVPRDLCSEFGVFSKSGAEQQEQQPLQSIFRSTSIPASTYSEELTYVTLYKSCWHGDSKRRSSATDLHRNLERFVISR